MGPPRQGEGVKGKGDRVPLPLLFLCFPLLLCAEGAFSCLRPRGPKARCVVGSSSPFFLFILYFLISKRPRSRIKPSIRRPNCDGFRANCDGFRARTVTDSAQNLLTISQEDAD